MDPTTRNHSYTPCTTHKPALVTGLDWDCTALVTGLRWTGMGDWLF